jgi:WD40 repeat protein
LLIPGLILGLVPPAWGGEQPPVATDSLGDPLPAGALFRLGTMRLRHQMEVAAIAFSPDGKVLASGSADGTVRLWSMPTGKELHQFGELGGAAVRALAFSREGSILAVSDEDSWISLWNTVTGKRVPLAKGLMKGQPGGIRALAFSRDGKTLASGDKDGTIRVWETSTGRKLRSLKGHEKRVNALAISADGRTLASASKDETVRLWDAATGKPIRVIRGQTRPVYCVAFSPKAWLLAAGGGPNWTVRLLNPDTGKEIRRLKGGNDIETVVFSPDGKTLASGGMDRCIYLWNVATGEEIRRLSGIEMAVNAVAFSPDGKTLAAGTKASRIQFWEAATGKPMPTLKGHEKPLESVAFSANGKWLATRSNDGMIQLWDAAAGKWARQIIGLEGENDTIAAAAVAFAADSRTLVSVDRERQPCRWDVATGKQRHRLEKVNFFTRHVVWSADGKTLATTNSFDGIQVWQAATGKELRRFGKDHGVASYLFFSPDGKILAAKADSYGAVYLWDPATGKLRHELKVKWQDDPNMAAKFGREHGGILYCAAFSADGKTLATVNGGGKIFLWDVATGKDWRQFRAQQARSIVFSPDGRTLATGDDDQVIRLWEVATGRERGSFRGHRGEALALAFSPDGYKLLSGSADTTALVWDVTGLLRAGRLPEVALSDRQLESLWEDLGGSAGAPGHRAIWKLVAGQKRSLAFLRKRLGPVVVDPRRVAQLIADLNNRRYKTREKASHELTSLGELAEPALRQVLKDRPSLEVERRVQRLLAKLEDLEKLNLSPGRLRALRTVEVLEHIGTAEARRQLKQLASGAGGAPLTREAKAALVRLSR